MKLAAKDAKREGNGGGRGYCAAVLSLAAGAALGAGWMYLYDPDRGRARRARLAEKGASTARRSGQQAAARATDVFNRAKGAVAKAGVLFTCQRNVDDEVLEGRVRSHLGHITPHAHGVETEVFRGVVTLHGTLPEPERVRLVADIEGIPGVRAVRDCLACEIPA